MLELGPDGFSRLHPAGELIVVDLLQAEGKWRELRRRLRRRPLAGIALVLPDIEELAAVQGALDRVVQALELARLPVLVLLEHSALDPADPPLGLLGTEADGLWQGILAETSRRALACASRGELAAASLLSAPVLSDLSETVTFGLQRLLPPEREDGLYLAGLFLFAPPPLGGGIGSDPLEQIFTEDLGRHFPQSPRPAPAWGRVGMVLVVAVLALVTAWGAAGWLWMQQLENRLQVLTAEIDAGRAESGLASPVALRALGEVAALVEGGRARAFLVPASWTGQLEASAAAYLMDRTGTLLVAPVRRQLVSAMEALEAEVAMWADQPLQSPDAELAAFAGFVERSRTLEAMLRHYRLGETEHPREQWESLVQWAGGARVALDWLDGPAGRVALGRGLAEQPGLAVETLPANDALVTAGGARLGGALASIDPAALPLDEIGASLQTLIALSSSDAAIDEALGRLEQALDGVLAASEAMAVLAQESAARFDTALAGLPPSSLSPSVRREAQARVTGAADDLAAALRTVSLPQLGQLLAEDLRPQPMALRLRTALKEMRQAGFIAHSPLPFADLTALVAQDGPPDPALLRQAAERLEARQSWIERHGRHLPPGLQTPLIAFVDSRVAGGALVEIAGAYRQGAAEEGGGEAELRRILDHLPAVDAETFEDVVWLAGVRTYRQLERLDQDFERTNAFQLVPLVRAWEGNGAVLRGEQVGSRSALLRLWEEGEQRLRVAVAKAVPLLSILTLDPVAKSLAEPQIVRKWRQYASVLERYSDLDQAPGYAALREYATEHLLPFERRSCHDAKAFPVLAGVAEDPFQQQLSQLTGILRERCDRYVYLPPPPPKPLPRPAGPVSIPW
ncbi:hypothetical protein [Telmatospirillum sp. J64-1]|uniref:hypothetical protein n=1 Tax=Telmatospirillum sp. J64-1 TaxID=2502183 RepID=UPI00115D55D4|nr:hypothetical protein [Telmatospirillum sp. J64-1]